MFPIETIAVLIIGYLIGSIPWAVIVAKRAGVDIFSVGSGNPGATNVLRTLGKPMGYTVFVLDFNLIKQCTKGDNSFTNNFVVVISS